MMSRMTRAGLLETVHQLQAHVMYRLGRDPEADEEQLIHNVLAALDLTPAEHSAVLDAYRERRKVAR